MTDVRTLITEGVRRLSDAGVASPRVDAVALLAHACTAAPADVERSAIMHDSVPDDVRTRYEELLDLRADRIPLQHLTGVAHFRHLTLQCGPGVFVPRPETELIVDRVLELTAGIERPRIVDLCTGSGAIALAIKDERPDAQVNAVELSPDAHAWAERNVATFALDVKLQLGDATTALPGEEDSFDVVVCNPPYIPTGMVPADPEVRDHDPELALYGGSADGLRIPVAIAGRAAQLLRDGGLLVMEHADSQGESLPQALRRQRVDGSTAWEHVEDTVDLAGKPRHVVAHRSARKRSSDGTD